VGMLVLALVLPLSAWSRLGVGESERESEFKWRARRRPGIKPWIWGMGKCPGVAVGQSNDEYSVRVGVRMLVTKRVLVLRLRAVAWAWVGTGILCLLDSGDGSGRWRVVVEVRVTHAVLSLVPGL
jgi:hypothetical protein